MTSRLKLSAPSKDWAKTPGHASKSKVSGPINGQCPRPGKVPGVALSNRASDPVGVTYLQPIIGRRDDEPLNRELLGVRLYYGCKSSAKVFENHLPEWTK
ncbi:hypothetical protein N7504_000879 [Penicillium tannophilum]|nr:hypothetical protein N7504_000879 [Penicillium tannophilum]